MWQQTARWWLAACLNPWLLIRAVTPSQSSRRGPGIPGNGMLERRIDWAVRNWQYVVIVGQD